MSLFATLLPPGLSFRDPLFLLLLLVVPVAIALAVLRHGLYEIDRVLNRTVVYSAVSVVLVALYAVSIPWLVAIS